MKTILAPLIFACGMGAAFAKSPDCAGSNSWPENMSAVYLKNAGLIDSVQLDWKKSKAEELVSEKLEAISIVKCIWSRFNERMEAAYRLSQSATLRPRNAA